MEETVKERLIKYLEYKKIGRNKFEIAAGLSLGYITKLKNAPRPERLVGILHAAPDLNRVWLLTGEGPMLNNADVLPHVEKAATPYTTNSNGIKFYEQDGGGLLMEVPIVPYYALGSNPDEYASLHGLDESEKEMFSVEKVYHGKYYAFEVDGDSMDDGTRDGFQRGDIVLVRELDREDWMPHLHLRDWPYWVVCWGNNVRLKEIVKHDGETITLHSLNPSPEYTDFTLDLNDVSHLFNVIEVKPRPRKFKKI